MTPGPILVTRPFGPVVRWCLGRLSPYRDGSRTFADPWGAIRAQLGDPEPDR
ncbi:hypothetical protein IRT45_02975 [Nocardia sp. BSTN01]|uniref:hypothetical protein n=1 Tax=Nocardia sp. BSTN01 TaxID=2783665 RepID=UPI0018908DA4|nr:hypothetical protein [Nocardia sp. BSTN01]MBF4996117.1 hypothetical protein [Nocardia sp. BSTN01]